MTLDILKICSNKEHAKKDVESQILNNTNQNAEPNSNSVQVVVANRTPRAIYRILDELMMALSFKTSLVGCEYLRDALVICLLDASRSRKKLSTEVYPLIANRYGISVEGVERAIRTAIRDCYEYGDLRRFNEIFRCSVINDKYPPTNAEFIANVTLRLRLIIYRDDDAMSMPLGI